MVLCIPVRGYFEANCFIYADDHTKHGYLIDPGAEPERLLEIIEQNGFIIEKMLITHGHFDHFGAVHGIQKILDIPVCSYSDEYLGDPRLNLSRFCTNDMTVEYPEALYDGDTVTLEDGSLPLRVLHTPGHTEDSVILYSSEDGIAFVGDTIFKGSIGTELYPGGSKARLFASIVNRIFTLPPETVLFSGHTDSTTVGEEIARYRR